MEIELKWKRISKNAIEIEMGMIWKWKWLHFNFYIYYTQAYVIDDDVKLRLIVVPSGNKFGYSIRYATELPAVVLDN